MNNDFLIWVILFLCLLHWFILLIHDIIEEKRLEHEWELENEKELKERERKR